MRKRLAGIVGLGIAAALVSSMYAAASSGTRSKAAASRATPVATVTTGDFRVVVTAERAGNAGAPVAVVSVTTSRRIDGRWRRTGVHRLRESYFWNTVTGPRAVCRLELRTAGSQPSFRPWVTVQLLVTPALGCGQPHRYGLAPAR